MKKIGLIARMDNSGLSTLSWEFAHNLKPRKVLMIDAQRGATFPERYKEFENRIYKKPEDWGWLLEDIDVLLSFETLYNWGIIKQCRKKGIKTVLVVMAELMPEKPPLYPDLLLCPDLLAYEVCKNMGTRVEYLPLPVNTERLQWRLRKKAELFIHSASHGGISGRKGTGVLLEAMKQVKADNIKLKIYSWKHLKMPFDDPRISIEVKNFQNYWQIWREGDVLVYPQGGNGICLPIIEAMASGLGVITTDFWPFNEYMYKPLLFQHKGLKKLRFNPQFCEVDDPILSPGLLAEKIDEAAQMDLTKASRYGKIWAEKNSWDVLLPKYMQLFNSL